MALMFFLFSGCLLNNDEAEFANFYLIVNESSFELFYSVDNARSIPVNSVVEIDYFLSQEESMPIPADDFFAGKSGTLRNDIFLYRDSAGIPIPALQLNTNDRLDWQLRSVNEVNHEHFLTVTDDLIN